MLQAQFKNGLPVKHFEIVNVLQDFEKHKNNTIIEPNTKIFVIDKKHIKDDIGDFIGLHFVDENLYFDYQNKYLICNSLTEESKEHLFKSLPIILAYYENKKIDYIKKIEF